MSKVHVGESPIQGKGVFARVNIAKGEPILQADDSRIVDETHPLRPELGEYEYHTDFIANDVTVLWQDPEKYTNHSCDPNTFVKTINGARYVIALRPIVAGEEITFDYRINGRGEYVWECDCGSPRCLKTLDSDFFKMPLDLQLEYLPLLDEWFMVEEAPKIEQLLQQGLNR
ncbi:MAG: hypothetical protein DPW16_16565 [Chloroflexi bacterium]|nr:hypothetical protein [Chloroflexota bacterium]